MRHMIQDGIHDKNIMSTLGTQNPPMLQMDCSLDRVKKLPHIEQPVTVAKFQDLINGIIKEWER